MLTATHDHRSARRERHAARIEAAAARSVLRLDRRTRIEDLLGGYRRGEVAPGALDRYVAEVEREVEALEAQASSLGRRHHSSGPAIRAALSFLRLFGRIGALPYDPIPIEERGALVQMLALEYRWCFAAAGTTARAFKIAIGRTGAR